MFDLEYQLKMLPDSPGVYLMKSSSGEIIYVGKAKILKNRVRQYFQKSKNHSEKVKAMVSNVAEFEYIATDSELEALILECNLIKKYRPKYNILMKDDKEYPFIKVSTTEDYPRVTITRGIAKDNSKYFGPYVATGAVYETLELLKKIFPLRTCAMNIKKGEENKRPCLNYHIGLCKAPCAGLISQEDYGNIVKEVLDLLSGKDNDIIKELKEKMESAAEELNFEEAAALRDKISAVKKVIEKQKIVTGGFQNEDFIEAYSDEKDSCIQVFFIRDGRIIGRDHFIIENTAEIEKEELISEFIKNFYSGTAFIPKNIYVPEVSYGELLENWLSMRRGSKVILKIPKQGEKKETLEMVKKNAKLSLEGFKTKLLLDKQVNKVNLKELQDILELEEVPRRLEAYDISNIQGMDSVGTMVVFEEGRPKNSDYRRFKIESVKGANDYDSMREILRRRFLRGLDETAKIRENQLEFSSGKFCIFPDLILMDGGKGQVNVAKEVLEELNINIPVCGMVKDKDHFTRALIYENNEIDMDKYSNLFKFIVRIQDEVHRFAISYHRSLRNKKTLHSVLEDIPNIGEKRRKALLLKFGSIEGIKKASYEELLNTDAIDSKAAQSIIDFFKEDKNTGDE